MADIAFNFFPIEPQEFQLRVYTKPYDATVEISPEESRRRLPLDSGERGDFLVRAQPADGFQELTCAPGANLELTKDQLFAALLANCGHVLAPTEFRRHPNDRRRRIFFLLKEHPEGRQEVWLEPYYLASRNSFGFLADFSFYPLPEHRGTRRAQQLALSLDHRFLANTNFYSDRFSALAEFGTRFHSRLFPLTVGTTALRCSKQLTPLPALSLDKKTYVFGDGCTSTSQFVGVKEHGPLSPPSADPQLCFLYRPQDRGLSQDLYRALRGESFKTFPGFQEMFGISIDKNNVTGMAVERFEAAELEAAAEKMTNHVAGRPAVAVVITPFDAWDDESTKAPYWQLKHAFLSRGIPSQVVSVDLLRSTNSLKWAVSNIGLGIFAKLGATPWRVAPQTERCLIVGIGQAHRRTETSVEKYFAYSVLTDSSGVYKEMRVLGEAVEEPDYLSQIRQTILKLIGEYSADFSIFVLHVPFTIRRKELEALHSALTDAAASGGDRRLVVMKFDDESKFFGYAPANNSLVPYESSYIKLSSNEFLVWFEGLQFHNPNVRKRYGRPVHVRFDYPRGSIPEDWKRDHLQDAVNLSGANWRGFNAKSLPVSVYYAKLIARHISHFQALGLPEFNFAGLAPWFL